MKDTIVLGLGNPLMGDEGVGCRVVELLQSTCGDKLPLVEFVDAGVGGMKVLHLIAGRRKAVFIDCARMGAEPGTIRRFTPDDVESVKQLTHLSLHEADLMQILRLSRQLGECPPDVVIFGIEPMAVRAHPALSPQITGRLGDYATLVRKDLETHFGRANA